MVDGQLTSDCNYIVKVWSHQFVWFPWFTMNFRFFEDKYMNICWGYMCELFTMFFIGGVSIILCFKCQSFIVHFTSRIILTHPKKQHSFIWNPPCLKKTHFSSIITSIFFLWVLPSCSPLIGGLEHCFYFSISWEFHHPNWRIPSFFRGLGLNHQPDIVTLGDISIYIYNIL